MDNISLLFPSLAVAFVGGALLFSQRNKLFSLIFGNDEANEEKPMVMEKFDGKVGPFIFSERISGENSMLEIIMRVFKAFDDFRLEGNSSLSPSTIIR
jgi:hypothetical protein